MKYEEEREIISINTLQQINAEIERLQVHSGKTNTPLDDEIRFLQERAASIIRARGDMDLAKLRDIQDEAMSNAMTLLKD